MLIRMFGISRITLTRGIVGALFGVFIVIGFQASDAQATTVDIQRDASPAVSVGNNTGGWPFSLIACPAGQIAVGIRGSDTGQFGNIADKVGLVCQTMDVANKTLSGETLTSLTHGGTPSNKNTCPTGQVLVGLDMRASNDLGYNVLTEARPKCQTLDFGAPGTLSVPTLTGSITTVNLWFGAASSGFDIGDADCPAGKFIVGFDGRAGAGLDQFRPYCGRISSSAPTVSSPASLSTATPSASVPISMSISLGGSPTSSTEYRWYRCPSAGTASTTVPGDCELISGATASSYTPTADDVGSYVRGSVTATNAFGSVTSVASGVGTIGLPTPVADLDAASDTGVSNSDDLTFETEPVFTLSSLVVGATVNATVSNGTDTFTCPTFVATSTTGTCDISSISGATLTDGAWVVRVQQSVRAVSSSEGTLSVTVDTAAPAAPSGAALAASSDTGANSVDGLTNDNTPTIDLVGLEVGTRVVVTASKPGSASVTCVIASVTSTSESCTFGTSLADGEWTFSAVQQDRAGNSSTPTAQFAAVIDTAAGVSLTASPTPTGSNATNATRFIIRATLTDQPDGVSAFDLNDVSIGGTSSGWTVDGSSLVQISATEYEFAVAASTPSYGSLTVNVPSGSYVDDAGNSATASNTLTWTIVVDPPVNTVAPAISTSRGTVATLGSTLSTTSGTWDDKGDIDPETSYRWQVCPDNTGVGCTDIAGATSLTFVPTSAQEGLFVRSVVTRTNVAGETDQASAIVGPMVKSAQEIEFANPGTKTYSPTPFLVSAVSEFPSTTTSTGLSVTMTSLTPAVCTVSGLSVTMLDAGTCTLAADQAGDSQFEPATQVTRSFTINPATESPTTTPAASQAQPGQRISLATNNASRGAVVYTVVSGDCEISGTELVAKGTGDCVVSTSVGGDGRYNASTPANITIPVRSSDAVSGPVIADQLRSGGPVSWAPTSSSGRAPGSGMTVATSGPCTYDAVTQKISPTGDGTCVVTASVADDGSWSEATTTRTFVFASPPSAPSITAITTAGADEVSGGSAKVSFTPGALNGSTLVNYSVSATPVGGGAPVTVVCSGSPCLVAGLSASIAYTFDVVTNASAAGSSVLSAASSASAPVTIANIHPISLANPGSKMPGDAPFAVQTASDIDPTWIPTLVSLTPSVCTVSGMNVTVLRTGTCSLQSSHIGGNSSGRDYGYGSATVSFRVGSSVGSGVGASPLAPVVSTPCQLAALDGKSVAGCPLANPLPEADGDQDAVGVGGENGAAPIKGLIKPPAPIRTVIERMPDGRTAKVTVTVRQDKPDAPVRAVVFVVFDQDGKVVARLAVEIPGGQETVVATVPFLAEGYQVRTYTTNEAGVSNKAPIGANVLNQPTTLGKKKDGTPILFGKKIAKPVLFDPDSPALDVRARKVLDGVVRYAARNGGRVFITGFVRNQGGDVRDQKDLSNARAEQVAMYLSKRGVDTWIRYNGYGAYRKGQGLPQDRRVEVRWSADEIPGLEATTANPVYATKLPDSQGQ